MKLREKELCHPLGMNGWRGGSGHPLGMNEKNIACAVLPHVRGGEGGAVTL